MYKFICAHIFIHVDVYMCIIHVDAYTSTCIYVHMYTHIYIP